MEKNNKAAKEYRDIKISSKRQFTIPKSYYDALQIEEEVQAYLLDDGIFLKPIRRADTVYEADVQAIVRKALDEGYSGDGLAKEIAHRINQYNRVLDDRVNEFYKDMKGKSDSREVKGENDYNGLDIFFDEEDGKTAKDN